MRPSWLISVLICLPAAFVSQAQLQASQGYLRRGSGTPVPIIFLDPPKNSPYAAPSQAPTPKIMPNIVPAPSPDASLSLVGACYCGPMVKGAMDCYHNMTGIATNNQTVISIGCEPPSEFDCSIVPANPAVYGQDGAGNVYRCTPLAAAPEAVIVRNQSTEAQAMALGISNSLQSVDYSGIFPNNYQKYNSSQVIKPASNVYLPFGQLLNANPQPDGLGQHWAGVDEQMNGKLDALPLEPPNPAICVGNGFVMEVTNDVLIVYSKDNGSVVAGPTDYQSFFGVSGPPSEGLSDSYCLYDAADSKRFYASMSYFSCRTSQCLAKNTQPAFSYLLLAVSVSSDPRDGFLGPYWIATDGINDATNEAYPGFSACGYPAPGFTGKGCLGDFPNPALDEHGFWFNMNMFTINASVLIGANLFGVRKADLLTGEFQYPSVVTYTDWAPYPGFTIVPSMTQATSNHSQAQGGSIFLMSSDSFSYSGQNNASLGIPSIRSWAVTNTSLLSLNFPNNATPTVQPPVTLLTEPLQFTSTALFNPFAPSQESVSQPSGPILGAQEERMRQVAFSGGYLYSCFQNPVVIGARTWQGLAFFVLKPNFTAAGMYTASIVDQGYVAVDGAHLLNGAITATTNGSMVITGSVVGPANYLSAFYAQITPQYGVGPIRIPKLSQNPLLNEGPGQIPQRRTGDYSTAVLDENDKVWVVAEWASDHFTNLSQPDTGNPRYANWGTYIMQVNPYVLT